MRLIVRLLSTLLGLALAGAGGLLAVEFAWAAWKPGQHALVPWRDWADRLGSVDWTATPTRLVAGGLVLLGLILVWAATGARRRDVRLADPAPEVTVTTSPRSLARLVGTRVRAQDGVHAATVTASRAKVRVRASSRLLAKDELRPKVLEVTRTVVTDLPLPRTPKVSVVVASPKERR
ncbi:MULTISPECIES: DUF6286 domain-containing protein [unclassified Crossiella]|uniref:DUF6286 domain-containing protein n=1 Tax=unclassified Crossiella TaxID=2620835 RepID=UPI001FFE3B0E|nr:MULTISPECIES: DUF6286 domain-containing protein [unclassified Crossiella]MCK2240489.1 DUF6286 domain-containing protein [Crossiella sp. S99.2]MCK2253060.1 DUF6286 domain-containing protein [Crossiella sp. S99.1]